MGCACSKGIILPNEHRDKKSNLRKSSKKFASGSSSFKRDEVVVEADGIGNDATALLMTSSPSGGGIDSENDVGEKNKKKKNKKKRNDVTMAEKSSKNLQSMGGAGGEERKPDEDERMLLQQSAKFSNIGRLPQGDKGALVVAGWPSWLSSVAGEAINGWIPRSADSFEKLEKIGQGTYSSVYKARDLETNKLVALKKVQFANMDPESVRFMAREIVILRRLDHPNIMKLEALITSRASSTVSLVFEYMEHDLTGLAASPGVNFSEPQVKCYMQQLLRGLEHCHKHGVLHRDIKGANLLIDNHGTLKIGDFGLATTFIKSHHQKKQQPMTSRVVTLWYRPPELLLGSTDYGPSVDLWSAGCILGELFAGKPIMPGRTEVEQLHRIFKLCGSPSEEYWKKSKLPHATIFKPQLPYNRRVAQTFKDFPSSTLDLLDVLLAVEPDHRGSASSALQHEFFTTNPLPLDPSSLPKYPPSKEFDVKLRDEENRRHKAAAARGHGHSGTLYPKESGALPVLDANANALAAPIQKRQGQKKGKRSMSEEEEKAIKSRESGGGRRIVEEQMKEDEVVVCHSNNSNGYERCGDVIGTRRSSYMKVAVNEEEEEEWSSSRSRGGQELSHHLLHAPNSSSYKDQQKESSSSSPWVGKKHVLHCSGPLLRRGGNMDEMLKEHERQIRNTVRKARLDKAKSNGLTDTESFLRLTNNTHNVVR